jgi:hypothetical protein
MIRKIFLFLLIASTPFWVPSAYRRTTHAFRPAKCLVAWPHQTEWDVKASEEIVSILKQPFHYLAKGGQSYVFESEDHAYVLKLFRYDTCRFPQGKKWAASVSKWMGKKPRHYIPYAERLTQTFNACMLSYRLAPKQTGLLYVHLNPKEGLPILTIRDRLGRRHLIDPAQYRFALQKKAEPFLPSFKKHGEDFIASYRELLKELACLGIVNMDPKLENNFGYLEGRAIVIDFGKLSYAPEKIESQTAFFEEKLSKWMQRHS